MNTTTFAVIYPFGTSSSYKLFPTFVGAAEFLDEEANMTHMMGTPSDSLTLLEVGGSVEEVEAAMSDALSDAKACHEDDDYSDVGYLEANAIRAEEVNPFKLNEIWAERDADGELSFLEHRVDGNAPEPQDGGEVVEAWNDDVEIYLTEDEGIEVNSPSQYLVNF